MSQGIIQLLNSDGEPAGLYIYDRKQHRVDAAIKLVEKTIEECEGDPDEADEILVQHGIVRTYADVATTDVF